MAAAGVMSVEAQRGARAAPPAGQVPRTPEGRPDFNGIWQAFGAAHWNIEPHSAIDGRPAGLGLVVGGEIPYQPWAREQQRKNYQNRAVDDPMARCFMPGVPRALYLPFPFEIVQTPKHIGMAFEYAHATRTIFLDNTPHLEELDLWMGDSRGRWEKDTLVIDTVSVNGRAWLDHAGNFYSQTARITERLTPRGPNHIDYEATIADPKVFTRPLQLRLLLYRRLEEHFELLDYECVEQFYEKLFDERAKTR
jgi:hypothetical protein